MNVEAALRAVRHPHLELALEVGLHLQKLKPEHLGMGDKRSERPRPTSIASSTRSSALAALLDDDVDGVLEDVVLASTLTQWTSRPHLEQLRENVSSSRSRSTFSSSRFS